VPVSSFNLFFTLLALAAAVGAAIVGLTLVASHGPLARLRADISPAAAWLAFVVAASAMAGSLYYSEIAEFVPCKLCWFQRICMYPLVVVLGVGALRRDRGAAFYALPLSIIGAGFSTYHYQLQRFPSQESGFCTLEAPCTATEVEEFGFVTIPLMALAGFLLVAALAAVLLRRPPSSPNQEIAPT
jgi:disulfide bond formation protein DsbB